MLILVGVTITVALNGGLFDTAQKAAIGTQKEIEKERLTEIAVVNYNESEGKITNADDLEVKIKNSLGFEKSDKTTDSKLVVQGKTGTLWQIDLNTTEVSEYSDIYRVAYEYEGAGFTSTFYLLEEGVASITTMMLSGSTSSGFTVYTNVNVQGLKAYRDNEEVFEISEDGNTATDITTGCIYKKNPTKRYSYNYYLNGTLGIYIDAIYLNSSADCPISTCSDSIRYSNQDGGRIINLEGITTNDGLKTKLTKYNMSISDDGTEITYDGKIYKLMDK